MTPRERYLARVAALECVLCARLGTHHVPSTVHHIRTGQGTGERASDYLTVALCPDCHQGPHGIHGDRSLLRIAKVEELDLLALTIEALSR
jgi:hypothetical protein